MATTMKKLRLKNDFLPRMLKNSDIINIPSKVRFANNFALGAIGLSQLQGYPVTLAQSSPRYSCTAASTLRSSLALGKN